MPWRIVILLLAMIPLRAANPEPPAVIMEQGTNHWAFRPVRKPKGNIDSLVAARLEREGLRRSPEASRAVLIRRLYFDLLGFPPTPEEVRSFVNARSSQAFEELVDRLLASPHYGERWARHWLDVVRFAESNGFETNTPRRNAWPYRDYVIRAFNDDLPYDQFIMQQLVGDLMGAPDATGFLVAGPWDEVKSPDPGLTAQQRMDELHDVVATTSSTFLGITVGCARCHNHKFDPISQVDYYAMQAVFAGVKHGERPRPAKIDSNKRPPVNARMNTETFPATTTTAVRFTISATTSAEPCIDELEVFNAAGTNIALKAKPTASGTYPNSEIHRLEHINDGKYGNSRSWISSEAGKGWVQLDFPEPVTINKLQWARDREEKFADRLATEYKIEALNGANWKTVASSKDRATTVGPMVYSGRFEQPDATHRLHRGEALQKKEQIVPAAPVRFGKRIELPADTPEQQRRLELAKWIIDLGNPLTARVMANRIWQFHFGSGIVETPSDFGLNGAQPSNAELLDWLAAEFVEKGWSIKHLHRVILLSATYRQSSAADKLGMERDVATRLYWRFPPRRLEAEALRDSILRVSGNLDVKMGGPGFDLFEPNENYVRVFNPKKNFSEAESRRMIYLTKHRMQLDDTFGAFDCPDGGQITPKRTSSTTPLQALSLLNSPFLLQQSEEFAERLRREKKDEANQINRAFELAFNRPPNRAETDAAKGLVKLEGLPALCRALLNANEFAYVF